MTSPVCRGGFSWFPVRAGHLVAIAVVGKRFEKPCAAGYTLAAKVIRQQDRSAKRHQSRLSISSSNRFWLSNSSFADDNRSAVDAL